MTSLIEKAQRPARIERQSDPKKPKFILGFEPGLLGQKAIALLLVLPPRPLVNAGILISGESQVSEALMQELCCCCFLPKSY